MSDLRIIVLIIIIAVSLYFLKGLIKWFFSINELLKVNTEIRDILLYQNNLTPEDLKTKKQ